MIGVTFHPLGPGSRTGTLVIDSNASADSQVVKLTGHGIYDFRGFLPPLLPDGSASIRQSAGGRTIPVKFQLLAGDLPLPSATATIAVYRVLDVATGTVDTTNLTEDAGAANSAGNLFRFDAASGQYIYNLSTQTFAAPATYRILVALDDGTFQTVDFSLRR